jgi:hypothetical protein
LDHEDQGTMRIIQIIDPRRPGGGDDASAGLAECAIPAPALAVPAVGGGASDLAALRGRSVVVVFFREMGCIH